MSLIPLECNPEVMTKFLHALGVPSKWGLVDVYSLDSELLALVPKPVLSMFLLYPISDKSESFKAELESREKTKGQENADNVYHMKQTISNACGTVALIHSVANNVDKIQLKDGLFKNFLEETKNMSYEERGQRMLKAANIIETHIELAQEGQSEVPSENTAVQNHFVAFVEKDGSIYELDGRKPFPINHGPSCPETFLEDAARVCREYMKQDPEEVRFTLMALAAND